MSKPSLLPLALIVYWATRSYTKNFSETKLGNPGNINDGVTIPGSQHVEVLSTEEMLSKF